MSYSSQQSSVKRTPCWLLKLRLDYCQNQFASAPCTATGTPCYYTYSTCKDKANFSKGERVYQYSEKKGPEIQGALPYILGVKYIPTEIDPNHSTTRRGNLLVRLADEGPLPIANPDKDPSNIETAGTYWKNLLARNPNYEHRIAELWQGFEGLEPQDFMLYFRGVIESVTIQEGKVELSIKDMLKKLKRKSHSAQRDENVLTSSYSGGSVINVTDASEFPDPLGNLFYPSHEIVKVGDKYAKYSGRDMGNNTLTGAGWVYGSSGTVEEGEKVQHVLVYATDNSGMDQGYPVDWILVDLICNRGKIHGTYLDCKDMGVTLTTGIDSGNTAIPVSDTGVFPDKGIVRIDDELIRYDGKSGLQLNAVKRGEGLTQADSHTPGSSVQPLCFTNEAGMWIQGALFRRRIIEPIEIAKLVHQLREAALLDIWQTEECRITAKAIAPPYWTETPHELTDDLHLIDGSIWLVTNHDQRLTRCTVYYDPDLEENDPGTNPEDYESVWLLIDAEMESENFYGEERNRIVFAPWIYRSSEASALASRLLIRYRTGAPLFRFQVELKDAHMMVGDFIKITSKDLLQSDGQPRQGILFQILKKEQKGEGRFEYITIDTNLSRRYPVISPTGYSGDYDSYNDEDQRRYGWIGSPGNPPEGNRVGSGQEDGYYIY
jgi:hypothetical protein